MKLYLAHAPDDWMLTRASGPGLRFAIFTRGCSIACTNQCLNAEQIPRAGAIECAPEDVIRALRWAHEDYPTLDGLVVLGGEPTDQAAALLPLLRAAAARGLSRMVYTGHVFEALSRSGTEAQRALLDEVDILVDGPYLAERASQDLVWRGSSNQRFHLFRYDAGKFERARAEQQRGVAILARPGLAVASGPQTRDGVRALRDELIALRRSS